MIDYIEIIGIHFPETQAEVRGNKFNYTYADIIWKTTPIPQATLDQYVNLVIDNSWIPSENQSILNLYNDFNYTVTKNTAVYFNTNETLSGSPIIKISDKSNRNTMRCVGVVKADIVTKSIGEIITYGIASGIDTRSFNSGDFLYVSDNGTFTNNVSGLAFFQRIGYVVTSAINGSIFIDIAPPKEYLNVHSFTFTDASAPYLRRNSNSFNTVARIFFRGTNHLGPVECVKIVAWVDSSSAEATIRLFDTTNNETVAEITNIDSRSPEIVMANGCFHFPEEQAIFEVQLKTTNNKYCYISNLNFCT